MTLIAPQRGSLIYSAIKFGTPNPNNITSTFALYNASSRTGLNQPTSTAALYNAAKTSALLSAPLPKPPPPPSKDIDPIEVGVGGGKKVTTPMDEEGTVTPRGATIGATALGNARAASPEVITQPKTDFTKWIPVLLVAVAVYFLWRYM